MLRKILGISIKRQSPKYRIDENDSIYRQAQAVAKSKWNWEGMLQEWKTTDGLTRLPCGTPEPASVIEADPGDDGQTPSGNRQVINGQEQQEEKSGKF